MFKKYLEKYLENYFLKNVLKKYFLYIIVYMEHTTLEEMLNRLTLEDIKQQLALYQKLYYHKRGTEEGFSEGKRESARQYNKRKALDKILNDKNIDIMNNLELTETKTAGKN